MRHCNRIGILIYSVFDGLTGLRRLVRVATFIVVRSLSGDDEPQGAAAIDREGVAGFHVQTRERSTVGVMARGVDGIARTIDLGCERHITEVRTTDSYRGDGSRGRHAGRLAGRQAGLDVYAP